MRPKRPKFSPYVDVNQMRPGLLKDSAENGVKSVTLAFVLAGNGCTPMWGGSERLDEPRIMNPIREFQKNGGTVIVATGGATGTYLENACGNSQQLAAAYKQILEFVGTNHLDIDIEAGVDMNRVSEALVILRKQKPGVTISCTLKADERGLTEEDGVRVLKNLKDHGVVVDIVNPMTMEIWTQRSSYAEAVIVTADAVVRQMKAIWPNKSDAELYSMLGVTPMIGRNFNGKITELDHAKQVVAYAKQKKIGQLAFWSLGRDNGRVPINEVSPSGSGIKQSDFEFCKIFNQY